MVTLDELTTIRAPIGRCFDLARSVEVHLAANVHWGESAVATGGITSGLVGRGGRVTWRARHFGVRQTLTSEITEMRAPEYFRVVMVRGAFRSMTDDHYFRAVGPDVTEMRDVFRFEAPFGALGRVVAEAVLRRYMRALLRERNAVVRDIAESDAWKEYLSCGS
jgi:ligand-binding SRPBCC domain-containing protein